MMLDLLPQDIIGPWNKVKNTCEIKEIYQGLEFADCFCLFNCQIFDEDRVPIDQYEKFVISFHTEYYKYDRLWNFFDRYPEKKFLLLTDWYTPDNFFPPNVTALRWITYQHQLKNIINIHGYNTNARSPTKKISSLAGRHEFHKAAITAYLLNHPQKNELVMSWLNIKYSNPYYLEPGFYIHPEISKYVLSSDFQNHLPLHLDSFINHPMANSQWRHPAYVDCVFNLSNESIFNSDCQQSRLPGPYLTEKTWKPLLSGCALIPVGQMHTINTLRDLGMIFEYDIDLSFDSEILGDLRLLAIYKIINVILDSDICEIKKYTNDSCQYNINHISSGSFSKICETLNDLQRNFIMDW